LEKDNIASKFAKTKTKTKGEKKKKTIYNVRIEKQCEHKKSRKIKITMFSLECSISFKEDMKSHMHFFILVYLF
jgi:hypothetical protein